MEGQFQRNIPLIGLDGQRKLQESHVLIVGVGGVGGYVAEMLARSGISSFTLVDSDKIDITNINRQIFALHSTVGNSKVTIASERIRDINPNAKVNAINVRFDKESSKEILKEGEFDCCVDAIDSVKDKVELILECEKRCIYCISALGAGNRLNARFEVKDIFSTSHDGLAKAVRVMLRKSGVMKHRVVCADVAAEVQSIPPASISYLPAMMGCILAQEVINYLLCR